MVFSRTVLAGLTVALIVLGASKTAFGAGPDWIYAESEAEKWEFSLTPYGWATSINGDVTARGHTADINESFIEIVEKSELVARLDDLFRGS